MLCAVCCVGGRQGGVRDGRMVGEDEFCVVLLLHRPCVPLALENIRRVYKGRKSKEIATVMMRNEMRHTEPG